MTRTRTGSARDSQDSALQQSVYDSAVRNERAVLSLVFENPDLFNQADLSPEEFFHADHRATWRAMLKVTSEGQRIDLVTILDALDKTNADLGYVAAVLSEAGALAPNFRRYVNSVRRAKHEREFLRDREQFTSAETIPDRLRLLERLRVSLESEAAAGGSIRSFDAIPDALAITAEESSPLVSGLIDRGTVNMLAGEAGCGKSTLAGRLSVGVALGTNFLGRRCGQNAVLILDAENPLRVTQKRLRVIAGGPVPALKAWGSWLPDPPPLIGSDVLLAIARAQQPLIVFDSFVRFHVCDENSSTEMRTVMGQLRALANLGATILLLHHRGKSQMSSYRGSSDIMAGVDNAFALTSDDDGMTLVQLKARDGVKQNIPIHADFAQCRFEAAAPEFDSEQQNAPRKDPAELLASIIAAEPGITQTKAAERSGLRREDAFKVLKDKIGKLWRTETGYRNAKLYFPLTSSRDRFPTSSRVEGLDRFREPVPEDGWTGSHIDSHCAEPVTELPAVPDPSSPYIEGEEGTAAHERPNGRTKWLTGGAQ